MAAEQAIFDNDGRYDGALSCIRIFAEVLHATTAFRVGFPIRLCFSSGIALNNIESRCVEPRVLAYGMHQPHHRTILEVHNEPLGYYWL